jgi:hypothetical protein
MLLGDWQLNIILTKQTGLPFAPVLANSVANTGASSRPNLLGDWQISNPTVMHWFNTALNTTGAPWATPAQFAYGNAGRGILLGPGRTNLDFSVFKQFSATWHISWHTPWSILDERFLLPALVETDASTPMTVSAQLAGTSQEEMTPRFISSTAHPIMICHRKRPGPGHFARPRLFSAGALPIEH